MVSMTIRCWICGVESDEVADVSSLDGRVEYLPVRWPAGDHEHEATPPTPAELSARGDAAMRRLLDSTRRWRG